MNYPDDFQGTNMDADKCVLCGRQDYTDDAGICIECEWGINAVERKMAGKSPKEQVETYLNVKLRA